MRQEEALRILKMGHSSYIAGEPGSGKTHLLNNFIKWLSQKGVGHAVTASTGLAATHIGGRTVHSFSGIGLRKEVDDIVLDKMEQKKDLWMRFYKTRVLIIDEISMLSGDFLDMLDLVCRTMKRRNIPFGGLQMVFCGDFFQLPPIEETSYAFQSSSWKQLSPVSCYLSSQYRQRDKKLSEILLAIREGRAGEEEAEALLKKRDKNPTTEVTHLFTHNIDVDSLNEKRLNQLPGREKFFEMKKRGDKWHIESIIRSSVVSELLRLKKGAEVIFVKNNPSLGYVNGTRGRVVDFDKGTPIVQLTSGRRIHVLPQTFRREEDGKVLAEVEQVPLRLAWAITVHKSQGMTLDEAEMDLGQCFVPGQGYVALSRVRSLEGVYLKSLNEKALMVDERVIVVDKAFREHSVFAQKRLKKLSLKMEKKYRDEFISEKQ